MSLPSEFDLCIGRGNDAFAEGNFRQALLDFRSAIEECERTGTRDLRRTLGWCGFAKSALHAYGERWDGNEIPGYKSITQVINDAYLQCLSGSEAAIAETARTFRELATQLAMKAGVSSEEREAVVICFRRASNLDGRLRDSAEVSLVLTHCMLASYSLGGGLAELKDGRETLQRQVEKHCNPSTAAMESPVDFGGAAEDAHFQGGADLVQEWSEIVRCVARLHGIQSVGVVDCAIAAARHLLRYEYKETARRLMLSTEKLLKSNPALDPEGLRARHIAWWLAGPGAQKAS